jgi:hypothetical protein
MLRSQASHLSTSGTGDFASRARVAGRSRGSSGSGAVAGVAVRCGGERRSELQGRRR